MRLLSYGSHLYFLTSALRGRSAARNTRLRRLGTGTKYWLHDILLAMRGTFNGRLGEGGTRRRALAPVQCSLLAGPRLLGLRVTFS